MLEKNQDWKVAGLATLCARFVQGWIYWGGGSRRFIYAPEKLDPHSAEWMGNKLQSAMPGAILGVDHIIGFLLQHATLLYISIVFFSFVELASGLGLLVGYCTRLSALITTLISFALMLVFGWQGATCMDEWTMAVATLAMGFTLTLTGSSVLSVDDWLSRQYPLLASRPWFSYIASGPVPATFFKKLALSFFVFTVIFTLTTYNYYRGAILTPYHAGPVSPSWHHLALSRGVLKADGSLHFSMYVDGGTPSLPSNIVRIELLDSQRQIVETWEALALSTLPKDNIHNIYPYNRIHGGPYGLVAPLSAKAEITLSPQKARLHLIGHHYLLVIYTINGNRFEMTLT